MSIEDDKNKYDGDFKDKEWSNAKKDAFGNLLINALIEIKNKLSTNPVTRTTFEKPTPEDVKKIHDEINQIVNQRFLITTLAITLFSVVGAWLVREDLNDILVFFVSSLLASLTFMLYIFSYTLKRTLRIFSTYLDVTGSSIWEKHWKSYREDEIRTERRKTWAYSKGHAIVFMLLGGFSMLLPFVITGVRHISFFQLTLSLVGWLLIFIILNLGYIIVEGYIGFRSKWDNEDELKRKWRRVLHIPEPTDNM